MPLRIYLARVAMAWFILVLPAITVIAATVPRPPLVHSAWTARDGAPSNVTTITQSSDGWIWFASSTGLYRFDGVSFEPVEAIDGQKLLSNNVIAVSAHQDQLWVGYQFGGISVFEHGKVRHYGAAEGLPAGAIFRISYDAHDTIWMSGSAGIAYLDGERWHEVPLDYGLTRRSMLVRAPDGGLWVQTERGVHQCDATTHKCHRAFEKDGLSTVMFKPDGTIQTFSPTDGYWEYSAADGRLRRLDLQGVVGAYDISHIDHRGDLWVGTSQFLHLFDSRLKLTQTFSEASGLSNVAFTAAFDDREGNVWFATLAGVDRMRLPKLTAIELPKPMESPSIIAGDGGAVWVSADHGFETFVVQPDGARSTAHMERVAASYRQANGAIWYGDEHQIARFLDGKTEQVPLPAEIQGYQVQAITMGPEGELWVSVVRHGVHTFKDGIWTARSGRDHLPASAAITLLTDPSGRVWLGYPQGKLAVVEHATVRFFSASDGLDVGNVLALSSRAGRLWVGGEKGLFYRDGERFRPLLADDGHTFKGTSGIVETSTGELWAHGTEGISRIDAGDLKTALAAKAGTVHRQLFDYRDGLMGSAPQIRPLPSLIQAGDGRIWYSTYSAVGWIDPANIRRNPVPPNVTILSMRSSGKLYGVGSAIALPPATDALQINYTALNFTMPERVRFRYRLDGVDDTWQEAGSRRTAFYNSLGPGRYTFRVNGINEDDVPAKHEAVLSFTIEPTLTQSLWFKTLLGVLALTGLWWLHVSRIRRVALRTRILLEERVRERARIARDLHDTLLQSMQATILKVHATALRIPPENPTLREAIDATVAEAQHALAEGRDRIQGLRSIISAEFAQELKQFGEELQGHYPSSQFSLQSGPAARTFHPIVHEELLAMAREAVFNAFSHSNAKTIAVVLHYDAHEFRLVVRDDGSGIPLDIIKAQGKVGHWGMVGINERGDKIGARVLMDSAPDSGTVWTFIVPAALAYSDGSRLGRLLRFWRRAP